MSEIEKMYKNAGCTNMWVQRYNDGYYEHEHHYNSYKEMISRMMKANDWTLTETQEVAKKECKKERPPFIAEKQLELIKFITSLGVCEIENWGDKGFHFAIKRERIYPTMFLSLSNINFEETIADIVNNLWQDLTSEEKQQVKGILE